MGSKCSPGYNRRNGCNTRPTKYNIMTKNQRLIHDALVDKLSKSGLRLDDHEAICIVIEQIKIGTGLVTIPE